MKQLKVTLEAEPVYGSSLGSAYQRNSSQTSVFTGEVISPLEAEAGFVRFSVDGTVVGFRSNIVRSYEITNVSYPMAPPAPVEPYYLGKTAY